MSYEICGKCHQPVEEWNEQRRRERVIASCHAMQGFLSNEDYVRAINYEDLAIRAVKAAGALLAELENK